MVTSAVARMSGRRSAAWRSAPSGAKVATLHPTGPADWLHRESSFVLTEWSNSEFGKPYEQLSPEDQGKLRGRLEQIYRHNGYDRASNTIRIAPVRARAFESCLAHFSDVFMKGNAAYAIPFGQCIDLRLPPPIFISRTVLVSVLPSSSANFEMTWMRSSPYFCGQWQVSQVSRAGRRLRTGVGSGRGEVLNVTAMTCPTPDNLFRTYE